MISKRKGFSLLEVIVACAIIGIAAKMVLTFSTSINQSQETITKQVTLTRVIGKIWDNILRDNAIIPGFDPNYGVFGDDKVFYFEDGGQLSINEDVLNSYFDETDKTKMIYGVRCYGRYGSEVMPPKFMDDDSFVLGQDECLYLVRFFKVRVPDKNFFTLTNCADINSRTCSLSRIPISNYYAQVKYFYNKIHRRKKIVTKLIISSLKTDVLEF